MDNIRKYPKLEAKDIRLIGRRTLDAVESQLLVIQTPFGYRHIAEYFVPQTKEHYASILYIH